MIPATVVIPTHNRRAWVVNAARCLVEQACPPEMLQIVIVTDRCTDGTGESVNAQFGDRVQVLESRAGGSSAAINTGLAIATGEIIITMDDEMQPRPEFVSAHVAAHRDRHRIAVTGYSPVILKDTPTPLERSIAESYVRFHEGLSMVGRKCSPLDLNAGNLSIRTADLLSVGGFNESYFFQRNDFELGTRLLENGFEFIYAPEARADQRVAITSSVVVNRAEPRAVNDVRLAREHPWCVEYLPFRDRLSEGAPRRRWKMIWKTRGIAVPAVKLFRKLRADSLALVNYEYGIRYSTAAIRAAGGWDAWIELSKIQKSGLRAYDR